MVSHLRSIPSVDRLLSDKRIQKLVDAYSRPVVLDLVRLHLEYSRNNANHAYAPVSFDEMVEIITAQAMSSWKPWPKSLINATGVILHTNMGRAPLSSDAIHAIIEVAHGYTNIELKLIDGKRGSRQSQIASLLCQTTYAENAIVVNNNASAVLLGLTAIAAGKEVIVSRGEAVEIGGGFRIPEVMAQSNATLVEVGTTNRTYMEDYERAITDNTGALLKVHSSNFRVTGFTHSPTIQELVDIGRKYNVPVMHDLGSGCLLDTSQFGLAHEAMPQESIQSGVDLAFFSGDKLLGGPQAGFIIGKSNMILQLSNHPLARAVRIDKLSLAAINATLLHYIKNEAIEKIPIWRMISASDKNIKSRANRWKKTVGAKASVIKGFSTIGGGSLPGETMPTWLLSFDGESLSGGAKGLAQTFRQGTPPVIGRIDKERVLLDPRTVLPEEEDLLLNVLKTAFP